MKKFALCLLALTFAWAATLVYANPPSSGKSTSPMDQKRAKEAVNVFQQAQQSVKPSPALLKQVGKSALWVKGFAQNQPARVNAAVKKAVSQGLLTPKQKLDLDGTSPGAKGSYARPWRTWPTRCTGPRFRQPAAASGLDDSSDFSLASPNPRRFCLPKCFQVTRPLGPPEPPPFLPPLLPIIASLF